LAAPKEPSADHGTKACETTKASNRALNHLQTFLLRYA
jgi:hypothetical protein